MKPTADTEWDGAAPAYSTLTPTMTWPWLANVPAAH
jgi:hypothetical protein